MISTSINARSTHRLAYITKLADVLRGAGYAKELLIANCVGGMMPPERSSAGHLQRHVRTDLAPIAGMHLTTRRMSSSSTWGHDLRRLGLARPQLVITPEATFGMEMLGIPKVDVRSVVPGRQHRLGRPRAAPRRPP